MTRNRCPNDLFGYCDGEPEFGAPPPKLKLGVRDGPAYPYYGIGKCRKAPRDCGRYLSNEQLSQILVSANPQRERKERHREAKKPV